MKSLFDRVREYVGSRPAWCTGDRTPPAGPRPERTSELPCAGVRRLLAITMLLG